MRRLDDELVKFQGGKAFPNEEMLTKTIALILLKLGGETRSVTFTPEERDALFSEGRIIVVDSTVNDDDGTITLSVKFHE